MKQSVILTIHGHVQGVGFRYFVTQKAENIGISGFVKNNMNGTVYIEAEGQSEELELFIKSCKQGPSHAWVEKVDVQYCPVQDFRGFERK
ncbi:MAG: acylphosphatase [Bacteroidales bacterium]|nr:acylphosphatase [Bacteroidales bacterium]